MRAVVVTRPGGPEVLEVQERPMPVPAANEILVRVHASALNRADLSQREGHYPAPPGAPADILGMEFAGEVADVAGGASVGGWKVGDRVFGIVGGGGNAEYLVTDAQTVARVPERLSWTDAAAVPEAFITAYDALCTQGKLQRDEYVLIHAVGSGVGLAATQLVRAYGAHACGTARTADKIDRARDYGLEHGCVVDDVNVVATAFNDVTHGHGIDLTMDLVGGPYLGASILAAARMGRIMLVGTVAGRMATVPAGVILQKRLTLRGTVLRARSIEEKRAVTAAFGRDVVPLLESGAVRPPVDRIYALEDIRQAHERLASNATFGKVVLRVS
jgi:NADPH:quinone reductase